MLSRRELLSAGFAGATPVSAAERGVQDDHATARIVRALDRIERQIRKTRTTCSLPVCPEVDTVRALQRTFLKGHQKFPDFIEVGIEIWERVYDWQVHTQQPVTVAQRPGERYVMTLSFGVTTLVLRPDVEEGFVGFPYDAGV